MPSILVSWMLVTITCAAGEANEAQPADLVVRLEVPPRVERHQPMRWTLSLSGMTDFNRTRGRPFHAMFDGYTVSLQHLDTDTTVPPFARYPMWEGARRLIESRFSTIILDGSYVYSTCRLLHARYAALPPGNYLLSVRPELVVARENTQVLSGELVNRQTPRIRRIGEDLVVWRLPPVTAAFEVVESQPEAKEAVLQRVRDLVAQGRVEAVSDDEWCILALSGTTAAREFLAEHLPHAPTNAQTILCCQLLNLWPREEALDQAQAWLRADLSGRLNNLALEVFRRLGTPADALRLREFLKPEAQGGNKSVCICLAP